MTLAGDDTQSILYFGYGSNMWLEQMTNRCPESKYIGIAHLSDWRWIISTRGYANIVPSAGDVVYGSVYELTVVDESLLDGYEGVPKSYTKEIIPVVFLSATGKIKTINSLVYVDRKRVGEGVSRTEYVTRMNKAIADALECGVPNDYINKYLRPFIRANNEELERPSNTVITS